VIARPDNHLDGFSERQYGWWNSQPQSLKGGDEMKLYGAIDLHSNNNVTVLMDEKDKVVYQERLTNDLPLILEQLSPYASSGRE
jgi:hypothetical protein